MRLNTANVFLDTCVVERENFNYGSRRLAALSSFVFAGRVRTFTTDITDREIVDHIRAKANEALLRRPSGILKNSTLGEVVSYRMLPEADVVANLLTQFDEFRRSQQTTTIAVPVQVLPTVINDYFERRPPFEDKKKSEFPDALAIRALEAWCEAEGEDMVVISGDAGVRAACSFTNTLTPVASLADYLNQLNEADEELVDYIQHMVCEVGDVTRMLERSFGNLGFGIADVVDGEVLSADLLSVDFDGDIEVLELSASTASVQMSADLTFEAEIEYLEPGTYTFDDEDGTAYGIHIVDTVERTVNREIGVDVEYGDIEAGAFTVKALWLADESDVFLESYPPGDRARSWV